MKNNKHLAIVLPMVLVLVLVLGTILGVTLYPTIKVSIEAPSWRVSWDNVLFTPSRASIQLEEDGYYYIIESTDTRCLLSGPYGTLWLADDETGKCTCLSDDHWVYDFNVAYARIYWINENYDVWFSHWQGDDITPMLFYEDALGVSHRADECQGAIVRPGEENIDYGPPIPIYSPYGE